MKRLAVFLIIVILLCGVKFAFVQNLSLGKIFAGASVEVYLRNNEGLSGAINNGDGQILVCDVEKLEYILNEYDFVGFTLKISNELSDVLCKLNPSYIKPVGSSVYGYKSGLMSSVFVYETNINFQCLQMGEYVLLGTPLLLGSY